MKVNHQLSGVRLAYQDEGSGSPILLVHGWGVSGSLFAAQLGFLSERFRVVIPDLPGHGSSSRFPAGALFTYLADSVAELISELRLASLCLVGWSMGAMIAWDLLLRYPQLDIAGLVTVDMVPRLLNGPDWPHGLRDGSDHHVFDRHLALMRKEWPAFTELFMSRVFAPGESEHKEVLLARTKKVAMMNDPESMATIWSEMVEQNFCDDLLQFDLPTLVVSGSQSRLYRTPASKWVAAHMPQAKLVEFLDSGHAPHIEEPEKFNHMLSEFIDSFTASKAQRVITPV